MKLLVTDSAKQDLIGIRNYYIDQGVPAIGEEQISQLFDLAERLIDHLKSGRVVPEFDDGDIREIIFPPYRMVYIIDNSAISIIRVWRSERMLKLPQ